ncbi:hypothetical protein [Paludibacterium purpuratum]|uniref:Uncharacterized protein n=1 Tax=Paludibacterium purpuratum TaxID=1144873 RepID=A0A4R7BER4_9NEIS|nr:hypothetical protein [Paludibacterium purpuratum]TDR82167.1 hypothetical protein DFP86_102281 [Paludibacterium purpuratum]
MLPIAQEVAKEHYLDLIARLTDPSVEQLTSCAKRAVMAAEVLQDELAAMSPQYAPAKGIKGCPACFGSGGKRNKPCQVCRGTGKVDVYVLPD